MVPYENLLAQTLLAGGRASMACREAACAVVWQFFFCFQVRGGRGGSTGRPGGFAGQGRGGGYNGTLAAIDAATGHISALA